MNIYDITKNGQITETKTIDHIEPMDFLAKVKKDLGVDLKIADIKHGWECMRVIKNRVTYQRCDKDTFDAKPITFCEVK